ncbi:MAG: hypothetical protein IKS19_06555 [Clostridia bacterium]|nr:hypothetical protein [Clostridia bacterium]
MNRFFDRSNICQTAALLLAALLLGCMMYLASVQVYAENADANTDEIISVTDEEPDETEKTENPADKEDEKTVDDAGENDGSSSRQDSEEDNAGPKESEIKADEPAAGYSASEAADGLRCTYDGVLQRNILLAVEHFDGSYTVVSPGTKNSIIYSFDKNGIGRVLRGKTVASVSYKDTANDYYIIDGVISTENAAEYVTAGGLLYKVDPDGSATLFSGVMSGKNRPQSPTDEELHVIGMSGIDGTDSIYAPRAYCTGSRNEEFRADESAGTEGIYCDRLYQDGKLHTSDKTAYMFIEGYAYEVYKKGAVLRYKDPDSSGEIQIAADGFCYNVIAGTGKIASGYTGVFENYYYNNAALGTASDTYYITFNDLLYQVSTDGSAAPFTGTYNGEDYYNGEKGFTGWKTENGSRYYYIAGKKATGWNRIDGNYYYFDTSGVMQADAIVGSSSSGYYYVDDTGIRITDSVVQQAVDFVIAHGGTGTSEAKLKNCYNYMYKNFPYKRDYGIPDETNMADKAKILFTEEKGNCFCFASAFAYVAKTLGFDARAVTGRVVAAAGGTTPHGWTPIKISGTWYIFDVELQTQSSTDFYKKTKHPWGATAEHTYELIITNGKVNWVEV